MLPHGSQVNRGLLWPSHIPCLWRGCSQRAQQRAHQHFELIWDRVLLSIISVDCWHGLGWRSGALALWLLASGLITWFSSCYDLWKRDGNFLSQSFVTLKQGDLSSGYLRPFSVLKGYESMTKEGETFETQRDQISNGVQRYIMLRIFPKSQTHLFIRTLLIQYTE